MRRRRTVRVIGALVALLLALAGCSSTPRVPDPTSEAAAYAAAWQDGDLAAAGKLTSDPAAAAQVLQQVGLNLSPSEFTVQPGAVNRTDDTSATVSATVSWTLGDAGTWAYDVQWPWTYTNGRWTLAWTPAAVHPQLGPQQSLTVRISKSTDGTVVDRDDSQLLNPTRVYSVLALRDKVTDPAATAAAILPVVTGFDATITADQIVAGIQATAAGGSYTVVNLRENDYQTVATALAGIPGVVAPSEIRELPPTKDFAKMLLNQVSTTTSQLTTGTKGWKISVIDSTGAELTTLAEQAAVPGQKVTLTLDRRVQEAADAAVAPITEPAVIVAIQPSTGEILAVAQNTPADTQGSIALTGRYPPGSTFKIVTATAGMDGLGLTPQTQLACPGSWVTDGRQIRNAHDFDLGTVDMTLAFAKSCNTTFAQVASSLPADALHKAALQYGVGLDFDIKGIITLTGQSPVAESVVQQAENGFGQGTDLVSPFSAALMAATVANTSMPMPVLIRGTTTTVDQPAPARSAAAVAGLPVLMRAVTEEGTGTQLQEFGDIYLKTGTAEFADDTGTVHAHAWTVGYVGDLAFSVFIVGGEDSYKTNQLATAFLQPIVSSSN